MRDAPLLTRRTALLPGAAEGGFIYSPYHPVRREVREVERAFARLFSTDDGQIALAHLQAATFLRALGPAAADGALRYMEGQRAVVATILRMIERGRQG